MKAKLTILALLVISGAYSQFGLSTGYELAKAKIESSNGAIIINEDPSNVIGIGAFYDIPVSKKLDLQPSIGLNFGEKVNDESNSAFKVGLNADYYFGGRSNGFYIRGGLAMLSDRSKVIATYTKENATMLNLGLGLDIGPVLSLAVGFTSALNELSKDENYSISTSALQVQMQFKLAGAKDKS